MTCDTIKTLFENLVEDSMDETLTYQLMNVAKDKIESFIDWEFLKKKDSSQTVTSSNTWTTQKSLPSDFWLPKSLFVGETDTIPYELVPFDLAQHYKNVSRKYYLDLANSKFLLTGTFSQSYTLYLNYLYATPDMATGITPVWPTKFHPILAFKMAELWFAKDQTELGRSWDSKWKKEYDEMWAAMLSWDSRIKVAIQRQGGANPTDYSKYPDIFT